MHIFKMLAAGAVAAAAFVMAPAPAEAHGGGLNREGCHNDRQRGTYHCHRASSGTRGRAPRSRRGGRRGRR
jgi:hypothetical protein